MKVNEATITDAVERGDSTTILVIVSTLVHKLNSQSIERKLQAGTTNKLRKAFMETQTDRDRLQRMVQRLVQVCEEHGLAEEALDILQSYGGTGAKRDRRDGMTDGITDGITIELD